MSHYTTEVRFICENSAGLTESQGYDNVDDIIEKSRTKIFSFDFPIFDESYRSLLETKILKHYYTREIGFETVGLWKLWLDKRLNEIMPYYNQLYKSELLEFNPLYDVDYQIKRDDSYKYDETNSNIGTSKNTRTDNLNEATSGKSTRTDALKQTTNNTSNTTTDATRTDNLAHHDTTTNSNTHYDLYSDTPQGALNGVNSEQYLTNARKTTDNGTETNDGTNTGTVKNNGTQSIVGSGTTDNTGTQEVVTSGSRANTGSQTNDGNTTDNGTKNYTNVDDYLEHVYGKRNSATYSQMLQEYRNTFLNIDMQVIDDLADLFMNVW